jgi:DnaK suppressor protein
MPENLDRSEIERALREHKRELDEHLAALAKPPERGALLGFGKRIGDGTTEAISRITEVGVGASLEVSLERVNRALAKLDDGTYGICDSCGKPIAPARLEAAPESVLCIDCASNR